MLCWNVYCGDFNSGEIEVFNIFNHYGFFQDCVKIAKKFRDNQEGFAEEIRRSLMYFFWSKCEWEIVLTQWPDGEAYDMRRETTIGELREKFGYEGVREYMKPELKAVMRVYPMCTSKKDLKIDVYQQVMNNWDIFIGYLWEHRKELKARKT